MGGLESKQSRDRENFLMSYQAIEHKTTGIFGECVIMKSNQGSPIILKEKTFVVSTQMKVEHDRLNNLRERLMNQTNLLEIKEIIMSSQTNLCSGSHKLLWAIEYLPRTLSSEFFTRRIQNQEFSEQEIWSLIKEAVCALNYLQSKSLVHGDVRPNTMFITEDGTLKMGYPEVFGTQNSFAQILIDRNAQGFYLSPKLMSSLEGNNFFPKHDAWKSDVFSLGTIILEVGNLKNFVSELYDFKSGSLHYDILLKEIQEFRNKYSQELTEFVWNMIQFHEDRRPDWRELAKTLKDREFSRTQAIILDNTNYQYRQGNTKAQKLPFERSSSNLLLQELFLREDNLSKKLKKEDSELDITRAPGYVKKDSSSSDALEESNTPTNYDPESHKEKAEYIREDDSAQFKNCKRGSQFKSTSNISAISDNFVGNSFDLSNMAGKGSQNRQEIQINRSAIMEADGFDSDGVAEEGADAELRSCAYGKEECMELTKKAEGNNKEVVLAAPIVAQIMMAAPVEKASVTNFNEAKELSGSTSYYYQKSQEVQAIFDEYRLKLEEARRTAIFAKGEDDLEENLEIRNIKEMHARLEENNKDDYICHDQDQNQEENDYAEPEQEEYEAVTSGNGEVIQAVETYIDGSEYTGSLLNGKRNGIGTMKYSNGGLYIGEWFNGMMQGEGELYYPDGRLAYKGGWKEEKFYGKGVIFNFSPKNIEGPLEIENLDYVDEIWEKYEGDFVDDRKEGEGTLFFTNGELYEGEFKEDMLHGKGALRRLPDTGEDVEGYWENNILVELL